MKEKESWFNWSLHLILGLALGSGLGFMSGGMLLKYGLFGLYAIPQMCVGAALLGGSVTSLRGNRLWYERSVFSEEEPELRRGCRFVSLGIGGLGVLVLVHAMLFNLDLTNPYVPARQAPGLMVAMCAMVALLFLWLGVYALREGTVFGGGRYGPDPTRIDREDSPLLYWVSVTYYFFIGGVSLLRLIQYLLR